jgi:phospholipid transport system substrate-binding protein
MVRAVCRAVMALAVLLVAIPAQAGGPTDRLKQYAETVQQSPPGADGSSNASSIFAVDEMAERVLGRHWPDRTATERAEFTPLFGKLLDRVYLSQIGRYTGDRLRYTNEVIDGARATVRAQVRAKPGEELPITLTMRIRGDDWLIDDILVAGSSILDTYRVQFDHIIRTSSYDELVKRLKDRRRSGN